MSQIKSDYDVQKRFLPQTDLINGELRGPIRIENGSATTSIANDVNATSSS